MNRIWEGGGNSKAKREHPKMMGLEVVVEVEVEVEVEDVEAVEVVEAEVVVDELKKYEKEIDEARPLMGWTLKVGVTCIIHALSMLILNFIRNVYSNPLMNLVFDLSLKMIYILDE